MRLALNVLPGNVDLLSIDIDGMQYLCDSSLDTSRQPADSDQVPQQRSCDVGSIMDISGSSTRRNAEASPQEAPCPTEAEHRDRETGKKPGRENSTMVLPQGRGRRTLAPVRRSRPLVH